METIVVVPDLQIPYHDKRAVQGVTNYIERTKPDQVVVLGDMLDFAYLSTKFLRKATEPDQILKDIKTARDYLIQWGAHSKALHFIEGNHEARLANYILEKAPQLEALTPTGFNVQDLLWIAPDHYHGPYGTAYIHKSFVFKHGDYASRYAAQRELEMEGSSGMSGHTHHFQSAFRTDRKGAHAWWSIGCLCNVKGKNIPPGVYEGTNRLLNWQQGFAVIKFWDRGFNVYPVVITNGHFVDPEGRQW